MGIYQDDEMIGGGWVDTALKLAPVAIPVIGNLLNKIIPERKPPTDTSSQQRINAIYKEIENTTDPKVRLELLKLLPK